MNMNGRGTYVSKLDRLIAEHEEIVRSLKLAKDLIEGDVREKKLKTNGALTEALAHEAVTRGPSKKKRSPLATGHRFGRGRIAAQRARSEEFLAHFDTKKPTLPPSNGNGNPIMRSALGPMVRRGYLAKKGDGYIRTTKPYVVNPGQAWKHKAPTNGHPTERQRREISAAFLAEFDPETPKTVKSKLLASMLRTGYLKRKGDGYIRTAKEFLVVRA